MSDLELATILADQVQKMLGTHINAVTGEADIDALRGDVGRFGVHQSAVPEAYGGHGIDWSSLGPSLLAWGWHVAPYSLSESLVAPWLLANANVAVPEDSLAMKIGGPIAEGQMTVKEGDEFDSLVVGEVEFCKTTAGLGRAALAVALSGEIAGCLQRALNLSIDYANTRTQFGKPIGKQQAIQRLVSLLAIEAAAAQAAANFGLMTLESAPEFAAAVAKGRASRAAGIAIEFAHQIHGAIGVTEEHILPRLTGRLRALREQSGNEFWWSEKLARLIMSPDDANIWLAIQRQSDGARSGSPNQ